MFAASRSGSLREDDHKIAFFASYIATRVGGRWAVNWSKEVPMSDGISVSGRRAGPEAGWCEHYNP
jgi:hypothetical protein